MNPPPTADVVVHARWILPMDPAGAVLEDHALVIAGGRVSALLPSARARREVVATETVERGHHVLLPGLVNAHTHAAMSLFRGGLGGRRLDDWLRQAVWPLETRLVDPEFVRLGTELAVAEMLLSGITCFADMYYYPEVSAQVAAAAGMRAVVGMPVLESSSVSGNGLDEHLAAGLELHDRYLEHPLVSTMFALHSPSLTQDATLARVRTLADQLQVPVMIHLLESPSERTREIRRHGLGPLERLDRAGLVNDLLLAVHCVQASSAEIARLAQAGASVVHCPASNLKLGSGIAPVAEMLQTGLTVALGTDGAASNDALDVLGECRLAALLVSGVSGDPTRLPPSRALAMGTTAGARALGLGEQSGCLAPGRWADFACMDLTGPLVEPVHDLFAAVLHTGGRGRITDTWVAGRPLVTNGHLTRLDVAGLVARVRDTAPRVAHSLAGLTAP